MTNPDCCGDRCIRYNGEVRLVPIGGHGNLILCRECFVYEMNFRRRRNRELGDELFTILSWDKCKVYYPCLRKEVPS